MGTNSTSTVTVNMEPKKREILQKLSESVVQMDEVAAEDLSKDALNAGIDPYEAIESGLAAGMMIVGEKYVNEEYFIPQVLLSSDAMYAGLSVLKPALVSQPSRIIAKAVIGVMEGDTHDIGKSLVQMMMEASSFDVLDLGRDVPLDSFISEAENFGARVICMSTLMSTTMDGMAEVIDRLKARNLRDKYQVVIGGGPVTQSFCDKIGADGYSPDASKAVHLIKSLVNQN